MRSRNATFNPYGGASSSSSSGMYGALASATSFKGGNDCFAPGLELGASSSNSPAAIDSLLMPQEEQTDFWGESPFIFDRAKMHADRDSASLSRQAAWVVSPSRPPAATRSWQATTPTPRPHQ